MNPPTARLNRRKPDGALTARVTTASATRNRSDP